MPGLPAGPAAGERLTSELIHNTAELSPDPAPAVRWLQDGAAFSALEPAAEGSEDREIVAYDAATGARSVLVSAAQLTPSGAAQALKVEGYSWSADGQRLLLFTNTRKVWRTNSRGDYWTLDLRDGGGSVTRVGRPSSEEAVMMYAKLSPCGTRVGWVEHNDIWVQDLESREVTQLTTTGSPGHGGTAPVINGNFDWAYEEELSLSDVRASQPTRLSARPLTRLPDTWWRQGWRWSPDGSSIAFW